MRWGMNSEQLVLVQGMAETRATLRGWRRDPWPVLARWTAGSAATCAALLGCVLLVAHAVTPDATPLAVPVGGARPHPVDCLEIFGRNLLVLALHAMACVAGFMAGNSMPRLAATRSGISRVVHEHAGRFAILFVIAATIFSLATQAYVLGSITATLSDHLQMQPVVLLLALTPHAVPELTALFLPLAAWTIASRRGEWNQLLAATFVTTALALPVLVLSALVEVYVSPHLVHALA
jgi:stage II sporulation SpoM-like protein